MISLGLDPSTNFGIAVVSTGKKVIFTEEVHFKKLTGFERINALVGRVLDVIEEYKPDIITIEEMFVGHASSAIPIIQIGSFLRYFLWQESIKYVDVPPTVLKKFVVGTGNAKKEQVMMKVLHHWGFESKTNNIADAVGIAMIGLLLLKEPFTKAQYETCAAIDFKYAETKAVSRN